MPKSVAVPDVSAVLMKARNLVESGSFEAEPVIVTLARFLLLHENQLGLSEEEQQEALSKYNIRGKRKTENLQKACSILRDIRQFAMDLGKNKDEAEKLIACAQRPAPKEELIIDALLSASKEAPATAGKPAKRTYRRRKATEPRTTAVSKDGSSLISQLRQKASELEAQADVLLKKAGNLRIEADELQQHEEEAAKLLQ